MKKLNHNICGLELDKRYANFLKQKKINVFTKELATFKTNKKFDLVTFNKVLEHVYDPLEMLKNSKRLLKQKGIIYIELPDVEAKIKGKLAGEFCIDHLQIFSLNSLDQLATKSGFKTIKLERIKEPSGKNTVFGFFKRYHKHAKDSYYWSCWIYRISFSKKTFTRTKFNNYRNR